MKINKIWVLMAIAIALVSYSVLADTNANTNVTANISNQQPNISMVYAVAQQEPTEDSTTAFTVSFLATDADGAGNLNDAAAIVNISNGGKVISSTSCTPVDTGANEVNYTCNLALSYFDTAGSWAVLAFAGDINGAVATDSSTSVTYGTLKAMKMGPTSLNFAGLTLGQTNVASDSPVLFNNTGNVAVTNISISATDLIGTVNPAVWIPAANFSVSNNTSPGGQALANGTYVKIDGYTITVGNHNLAQGQQQLYFYLMQVPYYVNGNQLTAQIYSTSALGAWVVQVE